VCDYDDVLLCFLSFSLYLYYTRCSNNKLVLFFFILFEFIDFFNYYYLLNTRTKKNLKTQTNVFNGAFVFVSYLIVLVLENKLKKN
jgi:hypothetical protein